MDCKVEKVKKKKKTRNPSFLCIYTDFGSESGFRSLESTLEVKIHTTHIYTEHTFNGCEASSNVVSTQYVISEAQTIITSFN